MSPPARIRWRGIAESRGAVGARLENTADVALVSRAGRWRWLVFRCPCGCGLELPVNLDSRTGPAWHLYRPGPNMTLYPSVWRESDCRSHFIVSRGRLWIADGSWWEEIRDTTDDSLVRRVLQELGDSSRHYFDIAEGIEEEPWDVLDACRTLVRRDQAEEAEFERRGFFRTKTTRG